MRGNQTNLEKKINQQLQTITEFTMKMQENDKKTEDLKKNILFLEQKLEESHKEKQKLEREQIF